MSLEITVYFLAVIFVEIRLHSLQIILTIQSCNKLQYTRNKYMNEDIILNTFDLLNNRHQKKGGVLEYIISKRFKNYSLNTE